MCIIRKFYLFSLFVIIFVCTCFFSVSAENADYDISAKSAIAYSPETGEIVYEKNAYEKMSMASTTKIMTALLTAENCELDEYVTVTQEDVNVEGSSSGLRAGDSITVADLIYCMLLPSGNDAANMGARITSGIYDDFIVLMNTRAKEIGMKNTHFATASGLDDDDHFSTAYDMALLAEEALKNSFLRTVFSAYTHTVVTADSVRYYLTNHNRLLKDIEGCKGIKTGFTKKSGRCLVTYTVRDSLSLIVVTLNAPDDWRDHSQIINGSFKNVRSFTPERDLSSLNVKVTGSRTKTIRVYCKVPTIKTFTDISGEIRSDILLDRFLYAPVTCSDVCGELRFSYNSKVICSASIFAETPADALPPVPQPEKLSFLDRLRSWIMKIME